MPKLFLFFCLVSQFSLLQAQTVQFTTGPEQKIREIRNNLELKTTASLIGKTVLGPYYVSTHNVYDTLNKKAYLIMGEAGDKYYNLTTYDNYVSFVGTKKLNAESISTSEQKLSVAEVVGLKGKNYIFYVAHNEKADEKTVYVNELSREMVVLGSPIKVVSATDVKKRGTSYYVKSSPKNKCIGILQYSDGKGFENNRILTVLNEDMDVLWTKTFDGNQFENGFEATRWEVSDDGHVYEFGFKNRGKEPMLYSYFRNAGKMISTQITHGENKIFTCTMTMPEGSLVPVVIGLFAEKKELGYVAFRPDPSSDTVLKLRTGVMTREFMGPSSEWQFYNDRFVVKEAVSLANGDFVFSLESYFVTTRSSGAPEYSSGPAILISLSAKGEENWKKLLIKRQIGAGLMLPLGHMLIPVGNQVLALYNDNPQNFLNSPEDHKLKRYYVISTGLVIQRFDDKGAVTKQSVETTPDAKDFALVPTNYNKISKDVFQVQFMSPKGLSIVSKTGTMTVVR